MRELAWEDREILRIRRKLAIERVLELALEADLADPEEFLRRCSSLGLDPFAVLGAARRGLPLRQRLQDRPPLIWTFRLPRSRFWFFGCCVILSVACFGLGGAIRRGDGLDVMLAAGVAILAILVIRQEIRRLP